MRLSGPAIELCAELQQGIVCALERERWVVDVHRLPQLIELLLAPGRQQKHRRIRFKCVAFGDHNNVDHRASHECVQLSISEQVEHGFQVVVRVKRRLLIEANDNDGLSNSEIQIHFGGDAGQGLMQFSISTLTREHTSSPIGNQVATIDIVHHIEAHGLRQGLDVIHERLMQLPHAALLFGLVEGSMV